MGASEFETDGFERVIDLLAEGPVGSDELIAPPMSVWAGIADELSLTTAFSGDPASAGDPATPLRSDGVSDNHRPVGGAPVVVSLADERARRRPWGKPAALATLAACVALLVAVPVGLALRSGDDTVEIASATLDSLDGGATVSEAALLRSGDGYAVELSTDRSAEGDQFLELWLLDINDDGELADLVSLGRVDGSGAYEVPEGIDLDRFDVVDVSIELDDGNDDHSGNSVLRGEFA
jgi:hypothetical protein